MILTLPVSNLINKDNYQMIPGIKALEYKDTMPLFENGLDVLFHSSYGIVQEGFIDHFDSIVDYLNDNKIKTFSFDLGPACEKVEYHKYYYVPKSKILSKYQLFHIIKNRIKYIRTKYNGVLAIENLNYFEEPAYTIVCDPIFITKVVLENNIDMVLDIAHALISAQNIKTDIYNYLSSLPLNKIIEVHLSAPGIEKGKWKDLHGKPDSEIFKILNFVLKRNGIKPYVAIEYYKNFSMLKDSYKALNDYFN